MSNLAIALIVTIGISIGFVVVDIINDNVDRATIAVPIITFISAFMAAWMKG